MIIIRSIGAILAGFIVVVVLSEGTDFVLRALGVFPPLEQVEAHTNAMFAAALSYRVAAGFVGGYVTAAFAPRAPEMHALILGGIGFAAGLAGTIAMWGVGPAWYPIALTILSPPSAWLGGKLQARTPRAAT